MEQRLPPRGIYRYSRNQVDREMCHRRQNSVMRPGDIGVVEVAQELEAQHPSQAHRHIRIAGEVKVDLEGKGQHAQPGPGHGQVRPAAMAL